MSNSTIHRITEFNDLHKIANGGLRTRHRDIQVFKFSEADNETDHQTPSFKSQFYQIGLFAKVHFEIGYFRSQQIIQKENVIVLIKPGQTVHFKKTDPNADGYGIFLQENFIDWRIDNADFLKDFPILNPSFNCILFADSGTFSELTEIALKMHYEYLKPLDTSTLRIIRLYCHILLEKIKRFHNISAFSPASGSVPFKTSLEFKHLVYQNIQQTKTVSDYADMLCISEKTLNNHFKHSTDSTPKEFINAVIIEESKVLLGNKATVDEVSDYFNFRDQAHFSNFFRKKTGHIPSVYKKWQK